MHSEALEQINRDDLAKSIYEKLLLELDGIGDYEVDAKKTSLHVFRNRAFVGVHPRRAGLVLNVVTAAPIADDRVRKCQQVSANRSHNEVLFTDPSQLDSDVRGWLRDAYALAST